MSLSEAQTNYIFFVFCGAAPLSVAGSSLLLTSIYRGARTLKTTQLNTYRRLMIGISVLDLSWSGALMFGPLPINAELGALGVPGAHGNAQTCTAQGFFTQLGLGSFCYSQMLMLYFVLVICYNVRDSVIERRVEPFMHLLPVAFYLGTAVAGLGLGIFNFSGNTCWVGVYPPGCEYDPETPCERPWIGNAGETINAIGLSFVTIPFMVWCFLIVVWLAMIAYTVVARTLKNRRRLFEGSSQMSVSSGEVRRMRQVVFQSFLYSTWFLLVMIFGTIDPLLGMAQVEYKDIYTQFWALAIGLFLIPLQGLMNFFIFIRPPYISIRREFPNDGRWFALREAV